MVGIHQSQKEWFAYHINLDHRVRPDHSLRTLHKQIDFTFVRAAIQLLK